MATEVRLLSAGRPVGAVALPPPVLRRPAGADPAISGLVTLRLGYALSAGTPDLCALSVVVLFDDRPARLHDLRVGPAGAPPHSRVWTTRHGTPGWLVGDPLGWSPVPRQGWFEVDLEPPPATGPARAPALAGLARVHGSVARTGLVRTGRLHTTGDQPLRFTCPLPQADTPPPRLADGLARPGTAAPEVAALLDSAPPHPTAPHPTTPGLAAPHPTAPHPTAPGLAAPRAAAGSVSLDPVSGPSAGPVSSPAVRLCVAVDTERYRRFAVPEAARAQQRFAELLDRARRRAGVGDAGVDVSQTGDGVFLLLPAGVDESVVIPGLVEGLRAGLADLNRDLTDRARLRLRVAMHRGHVAAGANGWLGSAVTTVHRLLDSEALRLALADAPAADFALMVSDVLYRDVVADGYHPLDPRGFAAVVAEVPAKDFAEPAWLHVPTG
ncbi:hypothetical protein AB0I60_03255 [Actinosynnema sp. NPDC050436]|uniref:hypothetical protein n=1 Tax=Actinosynnema sp. NPDC050436 TaxID=3155659 RepID=UPI0033E53972